MGDLITAGVITKTKGASRFCANPHIVRERREVADGFIWKYRMTLDFRLQNQMVKAYSYRPPNISDLLKIACQDSKFYASFDAASYFFQIPITEKSREITNFYLLELGQFSWNTTPMGNKASPAIAQSLTDDVCAHTVRTLGYIDDFLPHGFD